MENEVKNNANTSEDLVALRSENEKIKAENRELKQTLEQLMEQIRLARHKRFGASSEKNTEAEQLSIFNEVETPTSRLSYVNTNRAEAEKTQEAFCPGLRGIYIQTGMPDTTISQMILLWWDV